MPNGTIRRRRLPDSTKEELKMATVAVLRAEGEIEAIFRLLDADSARYLQPRFELILDYLEETRGRIEQYGEDLMDILLEKRELKDLAKCNGNGH